MGRVHDFRERLAFSERPELLAGWDAFYHSVWPSTVSIERYPTKCQEQLSGVDCRVALSSGRIFTVDEKTRTVDYGDALLEVWSVAHVDAGGWVKGEKPGWAWDPHKVPDFIGYAVPPGGYAYLLPLDPLRRALKANGRQWCQRSRGWYPKLAHNRGYVTASVAVPWTVLLPAMADSMRHPWTGGRA